MKKIFAITIMLVVLAGCSAVFAEDNTTQTIAETDTISLEQTDEIESLTDGPIDDGGWEDHGPYSIGVKVDFSYTGTSITDDLLVKVSDSKTGQPIPNLNVKMMFEPEKYSYEEGYNHQSKTDSNGIARCQFPYTGINYVYVEINDMGYEYSNAEPDYTINVSKLNIDIIAEKFTTLYKSNDKYEVRIVDSNTREPLKDVRVDLHAYTANKARTYYEFTNEKGIAYFSTKMLKEGTHKVTVGSWKWDYIFTPVTTSIKVVGSAKLTLKSVKIKKSAKRLVLQATLKTGKTPLKSNKITFKFNGKKYTAKTNDNGVAKLTIKKSALKKLKAGKKVTYQAIYGDIAVKKTATVKK